MLSSAWQARCACWSPGQPHAVAVLGYLMSQVVGMNLVAGVAQLRHIPPTQSVRCHMSIPDTCRTAPRSMAHQLGARHVSWSVWVVLPLLNAWFLLPSMAFSGVPPHPVELCLALMPGLAVLLTQAVATGCSAVVSQIDGVNGH